MPTAAVYSIHHSAGFALLAGLSLGANLAGCADPVIVDRIFDMGTRPGTDGGTTATTRFAALPTNVGQIYSQTPPPDYQAWKRDPAYVVDGTDLYMFYSGSAPTLGAYKEQWSIAYYKAQAGTNPPAWPTNAQLVLRGSGVPNQWDVYDVTAPMAVVASGSQPKYMMWYAGSGDEQNPPQKRPAYVTQIGLATSNDGTNWARSSTPVFALSDFDGNTTSAKPMVPRPDAYGATDPWVLVANGSYILYYAGLDCTSGSCIYQILRSVSVDGGKTFPPGEVVLSGRPGVAEEAGGVAGPSVIQRNGVYILTYTAIKAPVAQSRLGVRTALTTGSIGIATSTDGIKFAYAGANTAALIQRSNGTSYSEGASGPSVYTEGSSLKLYFGAFHSQVDGTEFHITPADLSEIK